MENMPYMSALLKHDPEYRFYCMAGADEWLEDTSFIVLTSDSKVGQAVVLEAMARGVKPVVRDFPGATEVFGRNYLFRTPEEFCWKILETDYDSEEYRNFVEQKHPLSRQLLQIDELFAGYEAALGGEFTAAADIPSTEAISAAV
jgi:glycosyltransferase involved in cell wall biosynthesis